MLVGIFRDPLSRAPLIVRFSFSAAGGFRGKRGIYKREGFLVLQGGFEEREAYIKERVF